MSVGTSARFVVTLSVMLSVALGASARASDRSPPRASALGAHDVCQLAVLAAYKRVEARAHAPSLLEQPATRELAGRAGKILMDVTVLDHGLRAHPLSRGDTCGDAVLVEDCHHGESNRRCANNPKLDGPWRVVVVLSVVDADHVATSARLTAPVHKTKDGFSSKPSPVQTISGHFERRDGKWVERPTS
jgi:hypothetical protein